MDQIVGSRCRGREVCGSRSEREGTFVLAWHRLQERKEHSHSWPRAVKSLQCHATAPHARCRRPFPCPPPRKVSVLLPACTVPDHFLSSSSEKLLFSYLLSWCRIFSCPSPREVWVLYPFSWCRIFSCPTPQKVSVLYLFSWYRIFSCPTPREGSCSVAAFSLGPSDGHSCGIR